MVEVTDRLLSEFQTNYTENQGGCWEWEGTTHDQGYGILNYDNYPYYAHRLSYKIEYGEIPDGKQINHQCHNPPCVNPDHLYAGTQSENMQDAVERGTHATIGEDHGNSRLKKSDIIEIRERYAEERTPFHVLADEFGVSRTNIGAIIRWRSWQHVQPEREDELKPDRLSDESVRQMRREYERTDATQYDLAEKYGVSQGHVTKIVNNRARKDA